MTVSNHFPKENTIIVHFQLSIVNSYFARAEVKFYVLQGTTAGTPMGNTNANLSKCFHFAFCILRYPSALRVVSSQVGLPLRVSGGVSSTISGITGREPSSVSSRSGRYMVYLTHSSASGK